MLVKPTTYRSSFVEPLSTDMKYKRLFVQFGIRDMFNIVNGDQLYGLERWVKYVDGLLYSWCYSSIFL